MFILFFKKYHDTASREVPSFGFGFFSLFFCYLFFCFFLGWGALRIAGWNSLFFWFFFQCELWRKSWLLFCNSFFFQNWLIETSSRWKTGVSLTFGSRPTDRGHHLWIENHLLRDVFFYFMTSFQFFPRLAYRNEFKMENGGFPNWWVTTHPSWLWPLNGKSLDEGCFFLNFMTSFQFFPRLAHRNEF